MRARDLRGLGHAWSWSSKQACMHNLQVVLAVCASSTSTRLRASAADNNQFVVMRPQMHGQPLNSGRGSPLPSRERTKVRVIDPFTAYSERNGISYFASSANMIFHSPATFRKAMRMRRVPKGSFMVKYISHSSLPTT